jgi:inner membrane protein
MLIRTHLSITLFFVLLLFPYVDGKLIFVIVALIATFLPDIDSRFSTIGRKRIARILQIFTKHRGMIHSFTFLISITFLFVIFYPVLALGFFLGYSLHLLADSFTKDGIKPFYPLKKKISGRISTGGKKEIIILVFFIIFDLVLFFVRIFD